MAFHQNAKEERIKGSPSLVSPMLATLIKTPFSHVDWLYERKFDGQRCLVVKKHGRIDLYSRKGLKLNDFYPEIVEIFVQQSAHQFVVDGELVAFTSRGRTSSDKLRLREEQGKQCAVYFYAFDLLHINGADTRSLALVDRKQMLKRHLHFRGRLRFLTHREIEGVALFEQAKAKGWEGIMGKKMDSYYLSKRSHNWVKCKCPKQGVFVVAGYIPSEDKDKPLGALVLGYRKHGKLHYAGKVGTRYQTPLLKTLVKTLKVIETKETPFAEKRIPCSGMQFVKPLYHCEVSFTEWEEGSPLRHPQLLKLFEETHRSK